MTVEIFERGKLSSDSIKMDSIRKFRIELSNGEEFTISENKFGDLVINKSDSSIKIEPYMSNEILIR